MINLLLCCFLCFNGLTLCFAENETENFFASLARGLLGAVFPDLQQPKTENPNSEGVSRGKQPRAHQVSGHSVVGLRRESQKFPQNFRDGPLPRTVVGHSPHSAFPSFASRGRTDLPASWVYPFAPRGTVIAPDGANTEYLALRPDNGELMPLGVNTRDQKFPDHTQLKSRQGYASLNREKTAFQQPLAAAVSSDSLPFVMEAPEENAKRVNEKHPATSLKSLSERQFSPPSTKSEKIRNFVISEKYTYSKKVFPAKNGQCRWCMPLDLDKFLGPWTQIYGNPDELHDVYGTLQQLLDRNFTLKADRHFQPSCIGLQISRPEFFRDEFATANLFFRGDDSSNRRLHECAWSKLDCQQVASMTTLFLPEPQAAENVDHFTF